MEIRSVELERLTRQTRAETEVLLPAGAKIAFTGGLDFNDDRAIWDTLDKVRAKLPRRGAAARPSPTGAW